MFAVERMQPESQTSDPTPAFCDSTPAQAVGAKIIITIMFSLILLPLVIVSASNDLSSSATFDPEPAF